ncbi:MAG: hypothetical protein IJ730_06070 [Alphaproteobacteria bacterium]|nr:hypothetical protein [Alphaproteobacteria bacterium]
MMSLKDFHVAAAFANVALHFDITITTQVPVGSSGRGLLPYFELLTVF